MSFITHQASPLSKTTPFAIAGVSTGQLSVARHYGGCRYMGQGYSYIPTTDELVRDDVVAWLAKHRKAQAKVGAGKTAVQGDMLLPANAKSQATDAALSRQVACTDGLGVAVPPAPTFGGSEK